jgi:hypothetical protein
MSSWARGRVATQMPADANAIERRAPAYVATFEGFAPSTWLSRNFPLSTAPATPHFVGSLGDRIRSDAIDADHGQQQCETSGTTRLGFQ